MNEWLQANVSPAQWVGMLAGVLAFNGTLLLMVAHRWGRAIKLARELLEDRNYQFERAESFYRVARRLQEAIRRHRDFSGDDRCWMDDEALYKELPEGYIAPKRAVAVELAYCQEYLRCRRNPNTEYISPQREIERLSRALRLAQDGKAGDYWTWQGDGEDHLESLTCPVLISADDLRRELAKAAAASSVSKSGPLSCSPSGSTSHTSREIHGA